MEADAPTSTLPGEQAQLPQILAGESEASSSQKFLTGRAPLLHQGSHAGVSHCIRTTTQLSVAKLLPGAGNKLLACLLMLCLPQSSLQQLSKSSISQNKMLSLFIAHCLLQVMITVKKNPKNQQKPIENALHKTNPDHHWESGVEFVMVVHWDGGRISRSMLCVCVYHDSFSL